MSVQKVSFVRSGIIAATVLFMLFAITLLGSNYWGRLTLIILGIGITLVYIGRSFAALPITKGERRTALGIRMGVASFFALSMMLDAASMLGSALNIPALPYVSTFYLFLFALFFMANDTWGKPEWRQLRQFLISVVIVVGGIFAWVSLMR